MLDSWEFEMKIKEQNSEAETDAILKQTLFPEDHQPQTHHVGQFIDRQNRTKRCGHQYIPTHFVCART
jgi:hypothetical protein